MKKLTTNQMLIGGAIIALIYILYKKKTKSKDLTGMTGSIPIDTVSDTVSDRLAKEKAEREEMERVQRKNAELRARAERERLEMERVDRLEKELKFKPKTRCDLLKERHGEDAVITYWGRIISKQVVDAKSKVTVGWSKNPNQHKEYKDGGCYKDIKYTFPY
tara:strand:- start:63 stop:548 length:486 start_codon:yes stop_codon:yes gene_type:complete